MYAIYKKELKNYFLTPIGYIFMSAFLAITAIYFIQGMVYYRVASVAYVLSPINMICLFIVPVLTMQLFAEEKNKKTDQLLLTAPVNVSQIVLGKYLAAFSVFIITLAISFIFPIIFFAISKPILSEIVGSYIGFILVWSVFIAVGVFISSCTESQVVSAILTFIILFVLYSWDGWTSNITQAWLKNILDWFSVLRRFEDFQIGLLNVPNIVYYISVVFVVLFLTDRNIEKRRFN